MDSTGIWIAPQVERLLSSYLNETSTVQVEDDDSNLRFNDSVPRKARIDKCTQTEEGYASVILTDSQTQIEATLTRASLKHYQNESPNHNFNTRGARGYSIQLLDYQVVLGYSTATPQVHLYIQRFTIEWSEGKSKSYRLGKEIRNKKSLFSLMRKVCERMKEAKKARDEDSAVVSNGYQPDDSFTSQFGEGTDVPSNSLGGDISQEAFVSQVPARRPMTNIIAERGASTTSTNLLGLLGSCSKLPNGDTESRDARQSQDSPMSSVRSVSVEQEENSVASQGASAMTNGVSMAGGQKNALVTPKDLVEPFIVTTSKNTMLGDNTGPESPARDDSDDHQPPEASAIEERITSPEKEASIRSEPVCQIKNAESNAVRLQAEETHRSIGLDQIPPDPWHGLTRIRKRDIRIPKDQDDLLGNSRCWVPPDPGRSMPQGHVPPSLLKLWNAVALQRTRPAEVTSASVSEKYLASSPPEPSSSAHQLEDPESEEDRCSWSASPDRDPRNRLPDDSSPVRTRSAARRVESPRVDENGVHEERHQEGVHLEIVDMHTKSVHSRHEDPEDNELPLESSSHGQDEQSEENAPLERPAPDNIPQANDESDEDSIMDTSVPRPLPTSSQQAQSSSQFDQDLTSSGPQLPIANTGERVQVVETPAANLSRLHRERFDNRDTGWEADISEQRSSQAAKSSSQSRICNTYRSNDSQPLPSQLGSNSSSNYQQTHSQEVDVFRTQLGSDKSLIGSTQSHSQLEFGMNSSDPKTEDQTTHLAPSAVRSSENSPSSDLPDEQHRSQSKQVRPRSETSSLEGESPVNYIRNTGQTGLKRTASELQGPEQSPSKRYRITRPESDALDRTEAQRPVSAIVSRRESYISSATRHAEAQRMFEKFRTDYPNYFGDFTHFTRLCSKLQALRLGGQLQRSFLWDDFIIVHLQEYPHYLEQSAFRDTKVLVYEDYFLQNVSRPAHKKRSLTSSGIEVSASQYESNSRSSVAVSPSVSGASVTRSDANVSFTASLVQKLSNFHAHSFEIDAPSNAPGADAGADLITPTMSSHTPHGKTQQEMPDSQPNKAEPEAVIASIEPSQMDVDVDEKPRSPSPVLSDKPTKRAISSPPREEVVEESESEKGNEDEDEDMDMDMDETHESASVELGDEDYTSTKPSAAAEDWEDMSDADSDAWSDRERDPNNWWYSMLNAPPTGPVWSDDANTPFKMWARADLNVLSERRRRGGRAYPTDDKGVPLPPETYPRRR